MASHSNWPSDFVELKKLEDILQCSICYEYIDTCMITPCSHNFCSLCIRKYLQFKTQCPTCFEETHGSDLRKNRTIDDVISIWVKLKDLLLFNLRLASMTQSVKTESKVCNGVNSPPPKTEPKSAKESVKSPKSAKKELVTPKTERGKKAVKKLFSEKKVSPEGCEGKSIVVDGIVIPSIFQPQKSPKKNASKKDDMSQCPVCEVFVPMRNLNMHLDSCLAAADPASSRLKPKPEKREPIPKRVYALMKEKDLKKQLKDFGLSMNGDRKTLIARLSRYIVLYNAECDKEEPRPVAEILRQVEREERDEKMTQSNPLFTAARPPALPPDKKKDPEAIEKVNKEYLDLNRENFKKLIENMRAREGRNIKPLKPLNRIDSEDEDDPKPSVSGEPGTSHGENHDVSVYSQETVTGSDSETDTFEKSPVKSETGEPGLINWDKTQVNNEPDVDTQALQPENNNSHITIEDSNSSSYDSVFNTSAVSESAKTPRSKLTLSARKRSKLTVTSANSPSTTKIGEKFTEIFEDSNDKETVDKDDQVSHEQDPDETVNLVNGDGDSSEEDTGGEESDSSDDEDVNHLQATPAKHDVSPEISPMKTRSTVKRKSAADEEKTPTSGRRTTRSKRLKPSSSPVY